MTAIPVLLTAANATMITMESGAHTTLEFDNLNFSSMVHEWDRQIRYAAEAGERSITIPTPWRSEDQAALSAFYEHFTALGFRVTPEAFLVSRFPSPSQSRLRLVISWPPTA